MDFSLTDTQRALQDTARKFAREVVRPKAAHYDEVAEFPKDLISAGYELGLMNMTVPPSLEALGSPISIKRWLRRSWPGAAPEWRLR